MSKKKPPTLITRSIIDEFIRDGDKATWWYSFMGETIEHERVLMGWVEEHINNTLTQLAMVCPSFGHVPQVPIIVQREMLWWFLRGMHFGARKFDQTMANHVGKFEEKPSEPTWSEREPATDKDFRDPVKDKDEDKTA